MLSVRVVKLGGNELDRPEWLAACADALRTVGPVVLVHGGGAAVSALSRRLALPVEKRDGRRVTTPEVAEAGEMVLAGAGEPPVGGAVGPRRGRPHRAPGGGGGPVAAAPPPGGPGARRGDGPPARSPPPT